jgi:hypothetical protein
MATIREYGRKCWHHVHAAWQTGELILGIGVAAVSYFGLSAAPVPPWLVYVGAIVFTLLYFIAIVQFRVWRTEAIQVQSLETQLRPAIEVDFKPDSEGIVFTPTEIRTFAIEETDRYSLQNVTKPSMCASP